jgi:hypothetical protein
MQDRWKNEQADAAKRTKKHWEEVQAKKLLLSSLDTKKITIEKERSAALKLQSDTKNHGFLATQSTAHINATIEFEKCVVKLDAVDEEIRIAEIPPANIYQPLPRDTRKALQVLFFMFVPPHFNTLGRLSLMAQQMLMPRSFEYFTKGK